jgi:hypothetical protein
MPRLRERLTRGDLQLTPARATQTLKSYTETWQRIIKGTIKPSTASFYAGV